MPVFNGEKYLPDSIESILNQTYNNFEFLAVASDGCDFLNGVHGALITDKHVKKINSLSSLILKSDIVSIHATLNKETYHMFNNKTLSKFKKNTLLINTSRGEIIDSRSLVSFLKKKKN